MVVVQRPHGRDVSEHTAHLAETREELPFCDLREHLRAEHAGDVVHIAGDLGVLVRVAAVVAMHVDEAEREAPLFEVEVYPLDGGLFSREIDERDAAERDRELVALKYHEGLGNVEIARQLGMNPSTVSTRLSRALARMRQAAEE